MADALQFSQSDPHSPARCRKRAMDALARREHTRAELTGKLLDKEFPLHVVIETLDRLAAEGLQSDRRFVEAFIASRHRQGKGPLRIRAELSQRGVADAAQSKALAECGFDWAALARQVRRGKFGGARPVDFKARARQMRFLSYRGFDHADIRAAFEPDPDDAV